MFVSGRVTIALADYFQEHFEGSSFGSGGGRILYTDHFRDFFIICEYPEHVIEWAAKVPERAGQVREYIRACRNDSTLLVRLAEDILARAVPKGRWIDQRTRKELLAALDENGYTFDAGKLVPKNEEAKALLDKARAFRRGVFVAPTPSPATVVASEPAVTATAIRKFTPRAAMERTIELARQCKVSSLTEPKVAALILAADGTFIGEAYRSELKDGEHAEYTLLNRKLGDASLSLLNAVVYTTLEPCTKRGPEKVPCAKRLLERRVSRVYIGMVDPNPEIKGHGQRTLTNHNVEVMFYEPDLMKALEELNRDFTRQFEPFVSSAPIIAPKKRPSKKSTTSKTKRARRR